MSTRYTRYLVYLLSTDASPPRRRALGAPLSSGPVVRELISEEIGQGSCRKAVTMAVAGPREGGDPREAAEAREAWARRRYIRDIPDRLYISPGKPDGFISHSHERRARSGHTGWKFLRSIYANSE